MARMHMKAGTVWDCVEQPTGGLWLSVMCLNGLDT
jgi:hypothetical protein